MKTLLDLIQEWAHLNEAKTLASGVLPPAEEDRWAELRDFYQVLMAKNGLCPHPAVRYSAAQIRKKVTSRSRLRVRTSLEIVVMGDSNVHIARVGNLSCGGALLHMDNRFEVGSHVILHLANVSRGAEVLPTDAKVVWHAEAGSGNGSYRHRMGMQFLSLGPTEERSLDALVVDSLETQLLSLSRNDLDPAFIKREELVFH